VVKVKNQLDETKYAVSIASTCFGHQYAHHQEGHTMSSEPNFQHSDPRMKHSICEAKIMNSFGDFFFPKKGRVFKNSNFKNIFN
jgi:hypothetical protein